MFGPFASTRDASELIQLLSGKVAVEVGRRLAEVKARRSHAQESVEDGRRYVDAMLGLEVWSHKVYSCLEGGAHDKPAGETHDDD